MDAQRNTAGERRIIIDRRYALFIEGVAGFMDCRHQAFAQIMDIVARRNAYICTVHINRKRMRRNIHTAGLEVITHGTQDKIGELFLLLGRIRPWTGKDRNIN